MSSEDADLWNALGRSPRIVPRWARYAVYAAVVAPLLTQASPWSLAPCVIATVAWLLIARGKGRTINDGTRAFQHGDLAAARDAYRAALDGLVSPGEAFVALASLATVSRRMGDLVAAAREARLAIGVARRSFLAGLAFSDAHVRDLGFALAGGGDIAAARALLEAHPGAGASPSSFLLHAYLDVRDGDATSALEHIERGRTIARHTLSAHDEALAGAIAAVARDRCGGKAGVVPVMPEVRSRVEAMLPEAGPLLVDDVL